MAEKNRMPVEYRKIPDTYNMYVGSDKVVYKYKDGEYIPLTVYIVAKKYNKVVLTNKITGKQMSRNPHLLHAILFEGKSQGQHLTQRPKYPSEVIHKALQKNEMDIEATAKEIGCSKSTVRNAYSILLMQKNKIAKNGTRKSINEGNI